MTTDRDVQFVVQLHHRSGLPRDSTTNTFALRTQFIGGVSDVLLEAAADELYGFYNTTPSGGPLAVRAYLSALLNGDVTIKAYPTHTAPPVYPIFEKDYTLTAVGGQALPGEVAVGLSYQAEKLQGFNQASRRGRIFIGPLSTGAVTLVSNDAVRPATGFVSSLLAAATETYSRLFTETWLWCVWSRLRDEFIDLEEFSVDNACDTIRSRGRAPTARTTVSISP